MKAAIHSSPVVQILRRLEPYAYQVAYFILQDGTRAEEAAKAALIELSRSGKLSELTREELRSRTKKLTISASLALAGSASKIR
ncbi:hypothetical protein [Paenibacillus harenae]|uniref:hypothetical protein n=1 Tax=Paenibacillus harenae TaxID=306543 RepID=UPI000421DF54|nr:hypothetical protein [Paenibacillus harenae]